MSLFAPFVPLSDVSLANQPFNLNWNVFFSSPLLTAAEEVHMNQCCFNKHGNSFLNKQRAPVLHPPCTETLLQLLCVSFPPKLQQQQSN